MKKIKFVILATFFAVSFSACLWQQPDYFPKPTAERLSDSEIYNLTKLKSARNGWVMQYFATEGTSGYPLLARFDDNNFVTMAAKNETNKNVYDSITSMYSVKTDESTVLSFDTYNRIIHVFADPIGISTSGATVGYGYEGDFEFTFISATDDLIVLKGKKRGVYIHMNRLDADQNWRDYYKTLAMQDSILFARSPNALILHDGNNQFVATGASTHVLTIDNAPYGFLLTKKGFHIDREITGVSIPTRDFIVSDDNTRLVSTANPNIYFTADNVHNTFLQSQLGSVNWNVDNVKMGPRMKELLTELGTTLSPYIVKSLKFSFSNGFYSMTIVTNSPTAIFYYDATSNENSVTYTSKGIGDNNANMFLTARPQIANFLNAFGTFTLVPDVVLNQKDIKFISTSDPYFWFYVHK